MNLPPIGFGCSPYRPGGRRVDLEGAVRVAAELGYRLFDLAELYGNERAVGRALRPFPRSELFLVGKVWQTNFRPAALRQACESSLLRLGADAFDLHLLHAPEAWRHLGPLGDPEEVGWEEFERRVVPRDAQGNLLTDDVPLAETWEAMRDLVRRGLTRRIGVSNFSPQQIEDLGLELPAANQIACSPYEPNAGTAAWCRQRGIRLMAHSPLWAAGLLAEPLLRDLASRHRASPAQIVLRWNLQKGLVPLPSSTDPDYIAENLRALDLVLDDVTMAAVDSLDRSR
ncbi:MAG TPA: aldo/keto reductase [Thermoanaerobaculia bacterium]|nr:aldo/keto reductase [Thermoanaerobaculia bacterium]